jgi:tricorn protease
MKLRIASALFLGLVLAVCLSLAYGQEKPLVGARYPAISPDGKHVAFSYMGDLWVVSVEGGKAYRLTDHVAYEREPIWSPDGQWLAFTSNRFGNNDVFLIRAQGGQPVQLTFHTSDDTATDFTPDGQWVIFRSSRASSSSLYKVSVRGGNELSFLETYWDYAYSGRISPDGKSLLFSWGMENSYWWRRGYRGANTAKLWIFGLDDKKAKMIVDDTANALWPEWSQDGKRIYFISDQNSGVGNIWSVENDGSDIRPVTRFKQGDARWLSVAANVPLAAYEKEFGIWVTELKSGESHRVPIEAPAEPKENRVMSVENAPVSEFRVSPDGKKIAAVVRGEIYVLSSEGGYARNITNSPWRERDIDWDKDSRNIIYVSDAEANPDLYIISALGDDKPRRLTHTDEDEISPRVSPDGKWIVYYRGKREIRLIQPDGGADRLLVEDDFGGRFAENFCWSPDSRYLAAVARRNGNLDIMAIDVATGGKQILTNTAYDESDPAWSPDGKFLLFLSNRSGHSFPEFTGQPDLYELYLQPRKPEFDEDDFEKLFVKDEAEKKEKPAEKKDEKSIPEVVLKLENLDRQTEIVVSTLGSEREFIYVPKDETVYFVSNMDGRSHFWKTSLKKTDRGRFEAFMPQVVSPSSLQIDKKGETLYYLSSGRIGRIELAGQRQKSISFDTKIRVDKTADYEQMLGELYETLEHYYYDETLHKVNWREIYNEHRPVLEQVREDQDFYDYANEMIGWLNSSHMGISGPRQGRVEEPSGHIGAIWTFDDGKVTLARIIKDSPLYDERDRIAAGDELTAVDGKPVEASKNIWTYFNGKVSKRLKLTFKNPKTQKTAEVSVKPISTGEENRLLLEEWISSRRDIVKQRTGDEVAYLYMRAMGMGDLTRFLVELERDAVPRKALILDLRFNTGGNVHDRVLEALMKPKYAKWRVRGLRETLQSTFGFTDKPVVLVTNEMTLSDGEMTANGFKTLKRGPIVGNTTYGWLIFTTSVGLMNGGSFRLPFWGCYTLDGKDLETSGGVKPDILVVDDLSHELAGQDPQLDKAIEKILELIGKK